MKIENPDFLETELITYLGNKRSLLNHIGNVVDRIKNLLGKESITFIDLFSGSGVVSRYMKKHSEEIFCNDLEEYSRIVNECYLSNKSEINFKELSEISEWFHDIVSRNNIRGFISEMYSPENDSEIKDGERVFFTRRNAEYIDTTRTYINQIPEQYQKFFLAPLIVESSIHTNTSGVFKGFYKNRQGIGEFGGEGKNALKRILQDIEIRLPILSEFECKVNISKDDAIKFSEDFSNEIDLVYLDPPYNQHPYGSNYFMLNLIAEYKKPDSISKVSGIPEDWNRSPFNKANSAKESIFKIVENLSAKYFLISYNSEGFVKKDEFLDGLGKYGKLNIIEIPYNTFKASRNLHQRNQYVTEFLFLLEKN